MCSNFTMWESYCEECIMSAPHIRWRPIFLVDAPKISPTLFLSATPSLILLELLFCFLLVALSSMTDLILCFLSYLPLCCLFPPQSIACHMQRLPMHLCHPCLRLVTPALGNGISWRTCALLEPIPLNLVAKVHNSTYISNPVWDC